MFHLRLIKGLSYDGAVSASTGAPDVFTDDPEKYKAALKSGYFKAIQDAPAATDEGKGGEPETLKGHLDPAQLETMSEENLAKLAGDMGLDVAGLKTKEELVAAISGKEVYAPAATDEDVDLSKMTVDKLREYAKENGHQPDRLWHQERNLAENQRVRGRCPRRCRGFAAEPRRPSEQLRNRREKP